MSNYSKIVVLLLSLLGIELSASQAATDSSSSQAVTSTSGQSTFSSEVPFTLASLAYIKSQLNRLSEQPTTPTQVQSQATSSSSCPTSANQSSLPNNFFYFADTKEEKKATSPQYGPKKRKRKKTHAQQIAQYYRRSHTKVSKKKIYKCPAPACKVKGNYGAINKHLKSHTFPAVC